MDQKKLYILVFIIILIILAIVFFAPREKNTIDVPAPAEQEIIIQEVNEEETKTAPVGLPQGIPVGTTITESYTLEYPERNVVQHSVTFISQSTFENLISQYETYVAEEDFTISSQNTEDQFATLYATNDTGDLSVVISKQAEGNQVQLTYLERN